MRRRPLLLALTFLLVALPLFLSFCLPPGRPETLSIQGPSQRQLEAARAYLISRFDPEVGLLSESEDKGSNILHYYPELEGKCFCWNTYWVYSDNLLAYHALRNHYEEIAAIIKQTYDKYVSRCGPPEYYEALFGDDIPDEIHDSRPYLVDVIDGKYIFIDKHNRSTLLGGGDVSKYADACIYKALDSLWAGDRKTALEWFHTAHNMFDGVGVRDATALDPNVRNRRYDTYKLALILYASRILEVEIENYRDIEDRLWDARHENGGIKTRVNITSGKPEGSANTETTSLALLVYEDELIQGLAEKARWAERLAVLKLPLIIIIACTVLVASWWFVLRKVRWRSVLGTVSRLGQVTCLGRPLGVVVLSAVNSSLALMFLAAVLAPFSLAVPVGSDPHGGAEAMMGALLSTFFMLGVSGTGFVTCAAISAGLWWGKNAVRDFTMLIYGIVLLGALLWFMGKGPQNLLVLPAIAPLLALMWTAALSGTPVDLSFEPFQPPSTAIILYRVAMIALAAVTIYILTAFRVKEHFSAGRRGTEPASSDGQSKTEPSEDERIGDRLIDWLLRRKPEDRSTDASRSGSGSRIKSLSWSDAYKIALALNILAAFAVVKYQYSLHPGKSPFDLIALITFWVLGFIVGVIIITAGLALSIVIHEAYRTVKRKRSRETSQVTV